MTRNLKILFFFSLLYFATRLIRLTAIPVFCDEAIYLRWSQIIKSVETLRFIPLTDGKQPLFMWLTVPLFKIFSNPLFAGRFLSVLSGWGSLLTLFFLSEFLFTTKIAILSSLIYLFLPLTFFFDRLALADNLLSFFGLLSLFLTLLLTKYPRFDLSMLLGLVLGLAWITKSPAVYFIVLSFFSLIVQNYKKTKTLIFPGISSIIAFVIFNLLRLGPQFHMIALRNRDYIWSFSEVLKHPLDPLKPHLVDIFNIYTQMISLPVLIATVVVLVFLLRNSKFLILNSKFLILASWWLLPLIANAALAKVFTARYVLFTTPPFIILMAVILSKVKASVLLLLFIPNLIWIYQIVFNPFNVILPSTETGYLLDWTSGWGIKPVADFIINRSKDRGVLVATEGSFGTLPNGLEIYTEGTKNLTVLGTGLAYAQIPEQLIKSQATGNEVYLLYNQSRLALSPSEMEKLSVVQKYPKPDGDNLILYQLNPPKN